MVLSAVVISLLAAPRAPADTEVAAYLPRVDQLSQLMPFLQAAGSRAALLRPDAWQSDVHPLISVDVTSPDSLQRVGIDGTKSLTSSRLRGASVACVVVSDVVAYRRACDAKLARVGEPFERLEGSVPVYAARDSLGRVLAAYALKGKESCAIAGHGRSVEQELPLLARALTRPAVEPGFSLGGKLPGVLQLVAPSGRTVGAVSLSAKELTLTTDGKAKGAPLMALAGAGPSPLGAFAPAGMAVLRARAARSEVPALVDQVVGLLPGGGALLPIARQASPLLTGNVAAVLSHVRVTTGLRTREARLFAVRFALLAEVSDAAAMRAALARLDPRSLSFREGTLTATLEGSTLVVANDADVRAKAVQALGSAAGRQAHGLEFDVDARLVAKGLQQVPLLEAVQTPELAGLVAMGSELGPLLLATERVAGFLDSSGAQQHIGRLTWTLDAKRLSPDAGSP